jgi:hypothetical protein
MRQLIVILTTVVAIAVPFAGSQAKVWDNSSLKPDSELFKYLTQRAVINVLYKLGTGLDKVFGITCKTRHSIKIEGFRLVQPVDFPEGAKHPVSGVWKYQFSLTRCDSKKIYNAIALARVDKPPRFVPLTPGLALASPLLARDASKSVAAAAGARAGKAGVEKGCKNFRIFDTRYLSQPHDVTENGKTILGLWKEIWTVLACGIKIDVPITFWSDGKGGTFFSAPLNEKAKK